jgi:SAM-dependent methyltransferase
VCPCGNVIAIRDGIVQYTPDGTLDQMPEVGARDRQADGYLSHSKFPTQIARVEAFLRRRGERSRDELAYDLGCGPGPFTAMLVRRGSRVVAVDFSGRSLAINRASIPAADRARVTFVRADLNALCMAPGSAQLLLMCDFLQHLGNQSVRSTFLAKAFEWLRPGGRFYLSFFNLNIKHYFAGDRQGSFSDGAIGYERLRASQVIGALPPDVTVESVTPLNVFQASRADRLAARLPGASWLARMVAVTGVKA